MHHVLGNGLPMIEWTIAIKYSAREILSRLDTTYGSNANNFYDHIFC